MKKLFGSILAVCVIMMLTGPIGECSVTSSTSAPIQVSAEIVPLLELTIKVHDGKDTTAPVVTVMNFEKLVLDRTTFAYSASHIFTVEASALTSGRAFNILQSGSQLIAPTGETLPIGCQIVTPNAMGVEAGLDTDCISILPIPVPISTGSYGKQQTWVGNNLLMYSSGKAGQRVVINTRYTLSSDSALGSYDRMDADLHSGVYSATVTYTLTLN